MYVCATVESALCRPTQCPHYSSAQTYIFENKLFPTTAVQQTAGGCGTAIGMLLWIRCWPQCSTLWHPRPQAWLQGRMVQWCCVAGGTVAGDRPFALRVELDGMYCTVLYCTALYCIALHCTVLYRTVVYYTALYCTALHCTVLYCTVL